MSMLLPHIGQDTKNSLMAKRSCAPIRSLSKEEVSKDESSQKQPTAELALSVTLGLKCVEDGGGGNTIEVEDLNVSCSFSIQEIKFCEKISRQTDKKGRPMRVNHGILAIFSRSLAVRA